jgi:Animal haem peroxidase
MKDFTKPPLGKSLATAGHGGGLRGDHVRRGSRTFVGRFGRMFRALPAAEFEIADLEALAREMSAEPERQAKNSPVPSAAKETDEKIHDGEENPGIASGYTYLGQFIDHDITFDPASSLQKRNDPDGLINFRTPALDLDCIYGRGPEDQPYMFDGDGRKFLLGDGLVELPGGPLKSLDLLRVGEKNRAVIGDKRNDENVIISQLQGVFLQFHNRMADELANRNLSFGEIQRLVRWHYQYVVLHDYLPKIVGEATMNAIWPDRKHGNVCGHEPHLCFYSPHASAYMPIEFAAAAYRFGHSMVRPIYRLNTAHNTAGSNDDPNVIGRFFIFAGVQKRGLNGFGKFPSDWAIDWSLFFDINGSGALGGINRVQPAYKIDTSLVNPLAFLPEFSEPPLPVGTTITVNLDVGMPTGTLQSKEVSPKNPSNLAIRNLLRGNAMGLPSGQDVARAMGLDPLEDKDLWVGKAQFKEGEKTPDAINIRDVAGGKFANCAPLWFYILAESNAQWLKDEKKQKKGDGPVHVTMGPVGGRIVAETLIGLLLADSHSFLNQHPTWKPSAPQLSGREFSMGDFVKYALNL